MSEHLADGLRLATEEGAQERVRPGEEATGRGLVHAEGEARHGLGLALGDLGGDPLLRLRELELDR